MTRRYVQFGGHTEAPEGWINFESSPYLRLSRLLVVGRAIGRFLPFKFDENVVIGDVATGLPLPDGSVHAVFCSHVLEHLSRRDCGKALADTFRMLAPGGTFRFVLPDVAGRCRFYVDHYDRLAEPAAWLMRSTLLGLEGPRSRSLLSLAKKTFGNAAHLWMWDERSMRRALADAGFVDVRTVRFGDGDDEMFRRVENIDRFFWSPGPEAPEDLQDLRFPELAMQARRPDPA